MAQNLQGTLHEASRKTRTPAKSLAQADAQAKALDVQARRGEDACHRCVCVCVCVCDIIRPQVINAERLSRLSSTTN